MVQVKVGGCSLPFMIDTGAEHSVVTTLHVHGAIYRERGLLTAVGKEIKNKEEILQLLEAVRAPTEVAVIHFKGHQKPDTMIARGNQRADQAAKEAAVGPDHIEVTPRYWGLS